MNEMLGFTDGYITKNRLSQAHKKMMTPVMATTTKAFIESAEQLTI